MIKLNYGISWNKLVFINSTQRNTNLLLCNIDYLLQILKQNGHSFFDCETYRMSCVFVLPREIIERLYTQSCECFDFTKAFADLETVKKENNLDKLLQATYLFACNYIKNIYFHTSRPPLLENKPCRQKDFVLSNNLTTVLKIHTEILEAIQSNLSEKKARPFQIIIHQNNADLLDFLGNPILAKSIEISNYINLTKALLAGTLGFYTEIARNFTPSNPETLISQLKFMVLTLRIFSTYQKKTNKNNVNVVTPI